MRVGLIGTAIVFWVLVSAAAHRPLGAQAVIDTMALRTHTFFLAHDALRGRGTLAPETEVAAAYIAAQCQSLGLTPVDSGYLQPLTLEKATLLSVTGLTIRRGGRTERFSYPTDVSLTRGTKTAFASVRGRAFFAGSSSDILGGALGDHDLRGSVALMLDPVADVAIADTLAARGAVATLQLTGDSESFVRSVQGSGHGRLYHAEPDIRSSVLPRLPSAVASPRLSFALLAGTSLLRNEPMTPTPLGSSVELDVALRRNPVTVHNVACAYRGAQPAARDTAIVFTAHYDHLGVGLPDASGDSIYNGFSDNAAGVAMLLAVAQAVASGATSPPRHTLLFLFFTAEEHGLLGSDYYVARPLWPLQRTAAVINLDAGAPPAPPQTWRLAGVDSTGIGALAIRFAQARGWAVSTSPPKANSDYFPFSREGVPAVFIVPGPGPYEGLDSDSSAALRERWEHYHRASDEWSSDFPFAGLARYAEFALGLAMALDRASAVAGPRGGR